MLQIKILIAIILIVFFAGCVYDVGVGKIGENRYAVKLQHEAPEATLIRRLDKITKKKCPDGYKIIDRVDIMYSGHNETSWIIECK